MRAQMAVLAGQFAAEACGRIASTTDKSFVRWQKQPVFTRIPLTLYITSSLLTGLVVIDTGSWQARARCEFSMSRARNSDAVAQAPQLSCSESSTTTTILRVCFRTRLHTS